MIIFWEQAFRLIITITFSERISGPFLREPPLFAIKHLKWKANFVFNLKGKSIATPWQIHQSNTTATFVEAILGLLKCKSTRISFTAPINVDHDIVRYIFRNKGIIGPDNYMLYEKDNFCRLCLPPFSLLSPIYNQLCLVEHNSWKNYIYISLPYLDSERK